MMNEGYLYETHLHTGEASACAVSLGEAYIPVYRAAGYSGIIVTDHFYNGNSIVDWKDDSVSWKSKLDVFFSGYEHAKIAGDKSGLQVFSGLEYNFSGDEYLLYGLSKEWLYHHPEILHVRHHELFMLVDSAGGLVVQAHPFRKRSYIPSIQLHPDDVHAVEVFNGGNTDDENMKALAYAREHQLPVTSGSDAHNAAYCGGQKNGGICSEKKLQSIEDFIALIKSGSGYCIFSNDDYER